MTAIDTLKRKLKARRFILLAVAPLMLASLIVLPNPAASQTATKPATSPKAVDAPAKLTPEEAAKLFEQHKNQLQQVEGEKDTLSRELDTVAFERARLKSELIEQAQRIRITEKKVSSVETEVFQLRAKEHEMRADFASRRAEMTQILAVLQRFGRQPPPVMVTERRDALNMVRSGMLMAYSFETVRPLAEKLSAELAALQALTAELDKKQERQKALLAELSRRRLEIEPTLASYREQLKSGQARLDILTTASARHTQAVTTLGELVAKLDRDLALQTNLGVYEAELKSGAAIEIKPEAKKLAFVQPARLKPALPFQETKGLLPIPADGVRLRIFGGADSFGGVSKGIAIETRDRAQITAPCDGWVMYADNFRNYGQLLIINAGGGYHIVLAGMEQIQVNVGQFVLAGEPVAIMAFQKSAGETAADAKPSLYVEFRKDQRPIDPDPWWSSGVEKG